MGWFMVVADGAGEYNHDFSVVWYEAESPAEAAERAVEPSQGYGRTVMFVVPAPDVCKFDVYETSERKVTEALLMPSDFGGE
jgi:hypothetical protein